MTEILSKNVYLTLFLYIFGPFLFLLESFLRFQDATLRDPSPPHPQAFILSSFGRSEVPSNRLEVCRTRVVALVWTCSGFRQYKDPESLPVACMFSWRPHTASALTCGAHRVIRFALEWRA